MSRPSSAAPAVVPFPQGKLTLPFEFPASGARVEVELVPCRRGDARELPMAPGWAVAVSLRPSTEAQAATTA